MTTKDTKQKASPAVRKPRKRARKSKPPTRRTAPITSLHRYTSHLVREASGIKFNAKLKSWKQAVHFLSKEMDTWDRERMYVLHIAPGNHLMGIELVAIGQERLVQVSISSLFRGAILAGACGIVLVHNHPSGNGQASPEDRAFTKKMKLAADSSCSIPLWSERAAKHRACYTRSRNPAALRFPF